jgi:hypothetical protein
MQQQICAASASVQVPDELPPGATSHVAFVPGSSSLLVLCSPCLGTTALLFDHRAGIPLCELQLGGVPTSLAVAPGGQLLAVGLRHARVLLLDVPTCGASTALLACDGGGGTEDSGETDVRCVAFCGDGGHVVAAVGSLLTVWSV